MRIQLMCHHGRVRPRLRIYSYVRIQACIWIKTVQKGGKPTVVRNPHRITTIVKPGLNDAMQRNMVCRRSPDGKSKKTHADRFSFFGLDTKIAFSRRA
jgi:hypothetical protein